MKCLKQEMGWKRWTYFMKNQDIALMILGCHDAEDGWMAGLSERSDKSSKLPIIMLTARADERDELQGFELGVDEYISKPFSPKILVARVAAILRRTNALTNDEVVRCRRNFD